MPTSFLGPLLNTPLDPAHTVMALMIGIAGGFFLAEIRVKPLMRVFARRKPQRPPAEDHGGPWG